jgi:hypothetical protein
LKWRRTTPRSVSNSRCHYQATAVKTLLWTLVCV